MPRLRKPLLATLVASLVFAALGSTVLASRGEVTYFEAPALLLDPSTRPTTLATLQRLGVRALRVELRWHDVAPGANSRRKPSFDPSDPAAYHWGQYDALIEAARPPRGADRRNGSRRRRPGARAGLQQRPLQHAATAVPARNALPQLELASSPLLRGAPDRRVGHASVPERRRPAALAAQPGNGQHRRPLQAQRRARPRRTSRRPAGAPADLHHRVRHHQQAQPLPGRLGDQAGRMGRDLRADRVPEPTRRLVLPVPAQRRPDPAPIGRLPDRSRVRDRQTEAAAQRLCSAPRRPSPRGPLHGVGPRQAGGRSHDADAGNPAPWLPPLQQAGGGANRPSRLLDALLDCSCRALAGALAGPVRPGLHGSRDRSELRSL